MSSGNLYGEENAGCYIRPLEVPCIGNR